MKKVIAILLSVSILIANEAPVMAQALIPLVGKTSRSAAQQAAKAARNTPNLVLRSAANQTTRALTIPSVIPQYRGYQVQPPLAPTAQQTVQIQTALAQPVRESMGVEQLSFTQIIHRANNGQTAFLPQAILQISNDAQRAQLLRTSFVTAGAAGEASNEELEIARRFWRTDLAQRISKFDSLATLSSTNVDSFLPVVQGLQDLAGLALLGTPEDVTLLKQLFSKTKASLLEPVTATFLVRGLLSREDWTALQTFFAENDGKFAELQNGVAAYLEEANPSVQVATTDKSGLIVSTQISKLLQGWGPVLLSATDPSLAATKQWMIWARNQKDIPAVNLSEAATKSVETPTLAGNLNELIPGMTSTSAQLQPAALPSTEMTDPNAVTVTPMSVVPEATVATPAPQTKALWNIFRRNNNNLPPTVPPVSTLVGMPGDADSPLARLQRLSIYLASFVMGLEVATPVITNFGTSFGLSLQDNILVAAATYTPYSVGALASNWTKKFLGRKGSLNLGLAMMGIGFLGGVSWVGLDGTFTAEADTMMQFYKALACITLASTGGVFVHNSVGPIMTELNAHASDLIRQKRSAMTELSRALGMASSFAFPFIATKILGYDWSFPFVMAIPFIGLSLLGTNLIHLPNTRPIEHATQAVRQASGSLLQRLKNNKYMQLFKEEKGAGSLVAGLAIMNAVEMGINNGFLFLLPSLTTDPSSQYLFGMAQFAAPFILGRYLAKHFLSWFPKRNLSVATGIAAAGTLAGVMPGIVDNAYALTSSLFLAETGISTLFTLSFARTAKNPATVDRLTTLIVSSALACAVGPVILSGITQALVDSGMATTSATAAAMIGIPAFLTILASRLFRRVESVGKETTSSLNKIKNFIKNSLYHPKQRRKRS